MAAHLKKRVYEEFSKVVQIPPEEAPVKKLRLSKPSKSAALHVDLCKASCSTDALQYLLQFARRGVEAESETDNSVRLKIVSLLGLLSKTSGFIPDCIVDDAINALSTEKSHQVLAQLMDTLLAIGSQLPDNLSVRQRLIEMACKVLGCLGTVDSPLSRDAEGHASLSGSRDVQSVISDYFADQEPRVRTAAIKAMLQLHDRGMKINQIIYDQACRLLSDDYEQVRSAAVQMVWVLSQLYPESIVPIPSSNEEVRLVDDSFGKISHMKAPRSHERAKELYASGEFSSGRKWADDAPKERLDSNAVNLIASGACGAFVHGLEDEMYEVRIAAVEALSLLAQSSPSFAEKCLDFLVDMFNDEIEEVRLQSIHDSSRDIREALHELLCYTNVSTKECVQLALLELLKNLTKYPSDRNSVWKCLKFLGSRHPTLVLPLSCSARHPYFDTPEPDMDDPAYIAVLVLVFNAAKSCPTMSSLFSDHTFRHYAYLRDSLSHLVPALRLGARGGGRAVVELVDSAAGPGSAVESAQVFLQDSLNRTELAGAADFCATYLRCQLLLMKGGRDPPHRHQHQPPRRALQEKLWNMAIPLCLKQNAMATAAARQGMDHHTHTHARHATPEYRQQFLSELPHFQESFVGKLLELPRLSSSKPVDLIKTLQSTLRQSSMLPLTLPQQLHRATATIIEPTGESDNPLKFTTGLVVALDLDATLEHVQDPQTRVKVQVLYPDGQAHVITPKPGDFRKPGPDRHRLITQVYLSHSAWTDPGQVEVRLLLAYSSSTPSKPGWADGADSLPSLEAAIEGTIPFSKSVKVLIMPKPARR
ncbi:LOW QUALITY PROTEIN: hypothetical protein CRUP_031703 [Coryphaenoides rupestris]|nr:LOW QUALITY PROTEIN: hypothetical protein CRUP_031703 [Coryphaenoides rupestris]